MLDAVSNPDRGDEVLRHLREHGVEKTYEKLEKFEEYTWEDSGLMGSSQGGVGGEMNGEDDAGAMTPQRACAAWEDGSQTFWPSFRDMHADDHVWMAAVQPGQRGKQLGTDVAGPGDPGAAADASDLWRSVPAEARWRLA